MTEVEFIFRKQDEGDVKITLSGYDQKFIDTIKSRYKTMDYKIVKEVYRKSHKKLDGFYWFLIGIVGASIIQAFSDIWLVNR